MSTNPSVDDLDIRAAIIPKSDQINADDLITGPITVTVEKVKRGKTPEQPWDVHVSGHKPWRPCKGMRRVIVELWGEDPRAWIGRTLRLYREPSVTWASEEVGGIRISGMSDIRSSCTVMVTVRRGAKVPMRVEKLTPQRQPTPTTDADPFPKFADALRTKYGINADDVCAYIVGTGAPDPRTMPADHLRALFTDLAPGTERRQDFDRWMAPADDAMDGEGGAS
jgi:hypothetical protein